MYPSFVIYFQEVNKMKNVNPYWQLKESVSHIFEIRIKNILTLAKTGVKYYCQFLVFVI